MRHKNPPAASYLLRSAAGFALSIGLIGAAGSMAHAQTTVAEETTSALTTSAAGDVTIDAAGTITLTDNSGPALTVDSNNAAVNNGTISIIGADGVEGGVNNATAVLLQGGADRSYTQSGTVIITDNFAPPTDLDDDILPDGPFALGTGRTGILISGASPFQGNVELQDSASLTIEGNDSFAINLDNTPMTQGGLTGNLLTDGTIALIGENNTAINVASNVIGDINNSGSVTVQGPSSGAFNVSGDIDGGFINSGAVLNSGFRSNTRPAVADGPLGRGIFQAEDLQNAASAIIIEGNISRGISLGQRLEAVLDADGAPILNADGSTQMTVTSVSSVQQFGSAPAIVVDGNGTPIAIGTVAEINDPTNTDFDASQQFAFINEGTLSASGIFDDFDATAFTVTDATLAGGISNEGTISATTFIAPVDLQDPTRGSAIARVIVLGDQAIADTINNTGIILASASEATDVVFADISNPIAPRNIIATAIDIGENATTNSLTNTGILSALITGRQGEAVAIRDSSGTLTSINNSNTITALGQNSDLSGEAETDFNLVAVDVSNNTTGFTYTQFQQADTDPNDGLVPGPPLTFGDILLGDGDDSVISSAGFINGDIDFAGGENILALSGGSSFTGNINNTGGLVLTASQGASVNLTEAVPVNLTDATFDNATNFSPVIDGGAGLSSALVASGDITFNQGATITPVLTNVLGLTQNGANEFIIATAEGELSIGDFASLTTGISSFLFESDFALAAGDPNTLVVTLDLRDPAAAIADGGLGLDAAQLGNVNADGVANSTFVTVVENLSNASELGNAFASITDANAFNAAYNQILPEIGAAARQFILAGVDGTTGAVGSHLDATRRSQDKPGGIWLQHFAYFADRELAGNSEQFRGDGFGFTGGVDTAWGPFHALGVNVGFSSTEIEDVVGQDEPTDIVTIQGGAYAGLALGKLSLSAYGGGGFSDFKQNRQVNINDFFGAATGDWDGTHINGSLRAGYDVDLSDKYWIRPSVSVDYLRLNENAYTEEGTFGVALDIDDRTSEIGSASAVINLGARYEGKRTWVRPSVRVGYKYDFLNDPTVTNFRFAGGASGSNEFLATQTAQLQSFLFPDQGLLLGFSISAGSLFSSVSLDVDSDIRDGFIRHTGRVVFRLLF